MNCDAVARPQVDELGGSRSPAAGYPGKRPRTWIALQTLRRVGAGGYPRHARVVQLKTADTNRDPGPGIPIPGSPE